MPEGDTIFRTAATLRRALLGRAVTRFETTVPAVAAMDRRAPVAGRTVSAVEPRGKHLLITFSAPEGGAPLCLHTHMRMTGSWHIYRPGEAWQRPARYAVVVIHTDAFVAPCFSAPVVELLPEARAEERVADLGPDVLAEGFDAQDAARRLRGRPELPIGVALLDQRLLCGIGNVYKSEVLFVERTSPFRLVRELPDELLLRLVQTARRLMLPGRTQTARRTAGGFGAANNLYVYGRSGEPCRVCGAAVRMRRQGEAARSTYYCASCQGVEGAGRAGD